MLAYLHKSSYLATFGIGKWTHEKAQFLKGAIF